MCCTGQENITPGERGSRSFAHHDVVYVFLLLRLRVGVIKTQVAVSVVLGSHAKVNEHCLQVQSTAGGGVSSWAILIKCGTKSRPSDLKLAI